MAGAIWNRSKSGLGVGAGQATWGAAPNEQQENEQLSQPTPAEHRLAWQKTTGASQEAGTGNAAWSKRI